MSNPKILRTALPHPLFFYSEINFQILATVIKHEYFNTALHVGCRKFLLEWSSTFQICQSNMAHYRNWVSQSCALNSKADNPWWCGTNHRASLILSLKNARHTALPATFSLLDKKDYNSHPHWFMAIHTELVWAGGEKNKGSNSSLPFICGRWHFSMHKLSPTHQHSALLIEINGTFH